MARHPGEWASERTQEAIRPRGHNKRDTITDEQKPWGSIRKDAKSRSLPGVTRKAAPTPMNNTVEWASKKIQKGSSSSGVTTKATPTLMHGSLEWVPERCKRLFVAYTNADQQAQQLGKKENDGAASSMTGAFNIAREAQWQGWIDDDVAWRGSIIAVRWENIDIAIRRKSPYNQNETESRHEAERTLITAVRHESLCSRKNEIGSCHEPKRKLINVMSREWNIITRRRKSNKNTSALRQKENRFRREKA